MPMTAEERKQVAKDVYEGLRRTYSAEVARQLMQDRHGLTEEQLNDIAPKPKSSSPKPQPPTKATLETELQSCAGLLRSVAAALRSPSKGPKDYSSLARNVDSRA